MIDNVTMKLPKTETASPETVDVTMTKTAYDLWIAFASEWAVHTDDLARIARAFPWDGPKTSHEIFQAGIKELMTAVEMEEELTRHADELENQRWLRPHRDGRTRRTAPCIGGLSAGAIRPACLRKSTWLACWRLNQSCSKTLHAPAVRGSCRRW